MEAHGNPKMEAHSAPEKETHSVPEMETQSWQGIFLEKNDNFSKCIEPQERNILAPDLFAVTWHQISESQPTQKIMRWSLQVDKISGGCSEMIPFFNFKKIAPPPRPEENQIRPL